MSERTGPLVPLLAVLGLALLAKLQPNLSSAVLIVALGLGMLFVSGQSPIRLAVWMAPAALVAALTLRSYQWDRILGFFAHRGGTEHLGWQVEQSLIALGSGGLLGKGIGEGLSKFCYLPYSFSDFILGMVGEETGFLGVTVLFALFAAVIFRGLRIARLCPDPFGQLLAFGLTLNLALNFFVHAMVGLGVGPVTGVPLPFISHGGSSLVANLLGVAVLLSISRTVVPRAEVRGSLAQPAWGAMKGHSRIE